MARPSYPKSSGPLPPPLPPVSRTVGQLVAETIAAYRRAPWLALRVGAVAAVANLATAELDDRIGPVAAAAISALMLSVAFALASALIHDRAVDRSLLVPVAAGVVVFLPVLVLAKYFLLPGLAWFALLGLAVPAALVERLGIRAALVRGFALARADYIHVLGGIATLVLLVLLTQGVAFFLLREVAENTLRVAGFLASLVVAPLLFLGTALLYDDQAARVGLTRDERRAARRSRAAEPTR